MSDKALVKIDSGQFARLDLLLSAIGNALWAINDQLKPLDNAINNNTTEVTKWLAVVAESIAKINPLPEPQPKPKGVIMATFKVGADNPDITIELSGSDFTDSEGNPTGAGDIDLSVESSNPDVLEATLSGQSVSADGNTVTAQVNLHFGASSPDMAALAYKANNRDTGALVAAGSDEFIVGAGEASVGSITSSVPLTPEP